MAIAHINNQHEYPQSLRIQGKAQRSSEIYMFEFYCFIHFKMQNGAFQSKFHEFGSKGI